MNVEELIAELETRDSAMALNVKELADSNAVMRTRIEKLETRSERRGGGLDVLSIGAEFIKSAELEALRKSGRGSARVSTKATILASSTGASGLVPVDARTDPVILPRRRMTVRQLLSPGRTASNAIRFVRLASRSNSAAMHSEGTTKAEQSLGFEMDTADVHVAVRILESEERRIERAEAIIVCHPSPPSPECRPPTAADLHRAV